MAVRLIVCRSAWLARSISVAAASSNRHKQFVIDGEAVVLGMDGISDFNALHAGKYNDEVQLYAFDVLALDGDDLRELSLAKRKTQLARLLKGRPDGIFISSFEQGAIGPDLFRQACRMGLEGLVSKHREGRYRSGRAKDWIKVKNRSHPASIASRMHSPDRATDFTKRLHPRASNWHQRDGRNALPVRSRSSRARSREGQQRTVRGGEERLAACTGGR
jgi:hypothetical protein